MYNDYALLLFITDSSDTEVVWEEENVEEDIDLDCNNADVSRRPSSDPPHASDSCYSLVSWLVYFLALLKRKYYISNNALAILLRFLSVFFRVIGQLTNALSGLFIHMPSTLYKFRKFCGQNEPPFLRYVVCKKCYYIYEFDDCFEVVGTKKIPKRCIHRSSSYAPICNSALFKQVELMNGRTIYYPIKVYCYMPLLQSFQKLLYRQSFHKQCDHWRNMDRKDDTYSDVYDGKLWQDFLTYEGKPLLSEPFTYGIMLNIDWFRPCKHIEYSVGAIYLTVMNLPRTLRFKQENVILIGLIPGPSEPPHDINPFLRPLVEELKQLFSGVEMHVQSFSEKQLIRCALLCVACDVPASRKVCGFLGHSATLGCSKCLKQFPGKAGEKDYSGFANRAKWACRDVKSHRQNVNEIIKCPTKTGREKMESNLGCRYSALLDLAYFDPVRMTVIDPMHNLYLGTAKHIMKDVWIGQGYISKDDLISIQEIVDSIVVPSFVGRIPYKIASNVSSFTADQFKNWTNLFSLICLRNLLPSDHLRCWRYFVRASRLLCQMKITVAELKLADAYLLQFCIQAEKLYGKGIVTPNMHLHCHLKQCIEDYGPIHNFWLFSYERYNGVFENFPSSNRSREIQFMQRFLEEFSLFSNLNNLPNEFKSDFAELLEIQTEPNVRGSLLANTIHSSYITIVEPSDVSDWSLASGVNVTFPNSFVRFRLHESLLSDLKDLYHIMYPSMQSKYIHYNEVCRKYNSICYGGVTFNCKKNCIVYLFSFSSSMKPCPARVKYFLMHGFQDDDSVHQHALAVVDWLKPHVAKDFYAKPLEIWWNDSYDLNLNSIIPVQLIVCYSVHCDIKFEEQTVSLMCPLYNI